jgi:amino acid transporter
MTGNSTTMPSLAVKLAPERRLTLAALVSVAYFTSCGGAFGLEALVGAVGPGWAFALLFLTPLLWSVPIAFMAAELTALMPEEGGYYIWVREALGPFWAVQETCWTFGAAAVVMAIFPVLFTTYIGYALPHLGRAMHAPGTGPFVRWLIGVAVIVTAMLTNWHGARDVGRSSKAALALVLIAFAVFVTVWVIQGGQLTSSFRTVIHDLSVKHQGAFLVGLSIAMFNYGGYDATAVYAGEVDQPRRNYPIALGVLSVLAIASYALPVLAGIGITTDSGVWNEDSGWPTLGGMLGGRWLGTLLAVAGMVSMWSLFNGQLLYASRIPYVASRDGWLPRWLAQSDAKTAAPRPAIFMVCIVAAMLTALSFGNLAILQAAMYIAALTLEFAALLIFRMRLPGASRSFRIPFGRFGLAYACGAPVVVVAAIAASAASDPTGYFGLAAVLPGIALVGVAIYALGRARAKGRQLA